jgi:hypothetical protein
MCAVNRQACYLAIQWMVSPKSTEVGIHDNIFGVSDGLQSFFNTGLLRAVITTIVASLAWHIITSAFLITFLLNPLIYMIIRMCLMLKASGLCSAAWLLALIHKQLVAGFQPDDVCIGTPEE